ncbi:hypothetical protein I3J14_36535 [Streptomyces sp. HB-N217]|uniref:hypothetical protein n=1 Tax=Streptomyces sp. HB-N217 TaxID=2792016 RepID=UPI0018D6EE9D|nr:hypothetical protein [Streptomyces sp. HB-N217]MBH5135541.1 hypothetical protein [Streptomyces sp. HB-N217]
MTRRPHEDEPYELAEPRAYKWTGLAYDMCTADEPELKAVVVSSGKATRVIVSGACPRCLGDISHDEILTAAGEAGVLGDDDTATSTPDPYSRVNVTCNCELGKHENRPPEVKTGCGITFTIEVFRDDLA